MGLKNWLTQWFGKYVSQLLLSTDFLHQNCTVINVLAKMVILHIQMLRPGTSFVYCCELNRPTVVLKYFTINLRCGSDHVEALKLHFLHQLHEWDAFPQGRGQGDVFRFCGAQGDFCLHLGGPYHRAPSILDDEASSAPGCG